MTGRDLLTVWAVGAFAALIIMTAFSIEAEFRWWWPPTRDQKRARYRTTLGPTATTAVLLVGAAVWPVSVPVMVLLGKWEFER